MTPDRNAALDLIDFVDASPSPYYAAAEALRRLTLAGFTQLPLAGDWPSDPGRYAVVDGGSLFAWVVPPGSARYAPFRLLGAHTAHRRAHGPGWCGCTGRCCGCRSWPSTSPVTCAPKG